MSRALKALSISSAVGALVLFLLGYQAFSDMCANEVTAYKTSPDGQWKVVLFERNCGATTGYSTQISLLEATDSLANESGNVFVAEGQPITYALAWESNSTVVVRGTGNRQFKKEPSLSGIKFRYE